MTTRLHVKNEKGDWVEVVGLKSSVLPLNKSEVFMLNSKEEVVADLHQNKNDALAKISMLATKQKDLELLIETKSKELATLGTELMSIAGGGKEEGLLPKAMQEIGMDEFKLNDGSKVTIKSILKPPSVGKDSPYRQVVIDWLNKSGNSGIVTTEVKALVGKGGDEKAEKIIDACKALDLQCDKYTSVNASTLKSLIEEMMEKGEEVPLEELHVYSFKLAKVTLPK